MTRLLLFTLLFLGSFTTAYAGFEPEPEPSSMGTIPGVGVFLPIVGCYPKSISTFDPVSLTVNSPGNDWELSRTTVLTEPYPSAIVEYVRGNQILGNQVFVLSSIKDAQEGYVGVVTQPTTAISRSIPLIGNESMMFVLTSTNESYIFFRDRTGTGNNSCCNCRSPQCRRPAARLSRRSRHGAGNACCGAQNQCAKAASAGVRRLFGVARPVFCTRPGCQYLPPPEKRPGSRSGQNARRKAPYSRRRKNGHHAYAAHGARKHWHQFQQ